MPDGQQEPARKKKFGQNTGTLGPKQRFLSVAVFPDWDQTVECWDRKATIKRNHDERALATCILTERAFRCKKGKFQKGKFQAEERCAHGMSRG